MRLFLLLILIPFYLLAHPHVFVDVEFDINFDQTEATVDVIWRFDEMTSSMLLMDFDMNMDGRLDEEESLFLKKHAFDHLESLGYYTVISMGKDEYNPTVIDTFQAYFEEDKMVYDFSFSFPLLENINKFNIGCYDEDNLVAFFLTPSVKVLSSEENIHLSHESKRENRDYYDATILFISWEER